MTSSDSSQTTASEISEDSAAGIRYQVLEHLNLLASRQQQVGYKSDVPIADVPAELVCGWFDDLYHPNEPAFLAAFSQEERAALAEFHAVFETAMSTLEGSLESLQSLHSNRAWTTVVEAAGRALHEMGEGAF